MNSPHGAKSLVERRWPASRISRCRNMPVIAASHRVISDLHNIASGVFTPLEGFLGGRAMSSVLERCRLPGGAIWTIPILFDVSEEAAENVSEGDEAAIADEQGNIHGIIEIEEKYAHDRRRHARLLFGTLDPGHAGVRAVLDSGGVLLAGRVRAFERAAKSPYHVDPARTRELFESRGWRTVAGFQTRNVLHRAHEYLQRCALEITDGLFIQPLVGWVKSGDYRPEVITRVYPDFIRSFYPRRSVAFGVLDTAMRYAGPKDAAFHAIIRKNFGCTHFIVGRDHAGVGGFYPPYAAQEFVAGLGDIGIQILPFKEPAYCPRCAMIVTERNCGHSAGHVRISGTLIRSYLSGGKKPPEYVLRPEIYRALKRLQAHGGLFHP